MAKVVVLGGGYSGLACLIELFKKEKRLELHLVDAHPTHCKITNLHKTFRHPVEKFSIPYSRLAEKFRFTFHQACMAFSQEDLFEWQAAKVLSLPRYDVSFDYLVISTGAAPVEMLGGENTLGQNDLRRGEGKKVLDELIQTRGRDVLRISVVGGGATGIQFLFELHEELRRNRIPNKIRLVDLNPCLVPDRPKGFHAYISKKMARGGMDYLSGTRYLGQSGRQIYLEKVSTGLGYSLPSDLTLLFPGVVASPLRIETNAYGQVQAKGQALTNIFATGDCSHFNSSGLNLLTAQAAIRKGKLVARNILSLGEGKSLQRYRYQEKGYIISLGATDAIGWVGLKCNLFKGYKASVVKDVMEAQYDLYLDGIDTYVNVFPNF